MKLLNDDIRYIVTDTKTNIVSYYTKWQWLLAFGIIFLCGIGTGILLFYTYGT